MGAIKGSGEELYLHKKKLSVLGSFGNVKSINYSDIYKIEYCYREGIDGGYIDFHEDASRFVRFNFPKKCNDIIEKVVSKLQEVCPDADVVLIDANQIPFYEKNIFLILITLVLPVVAIILVWCSGKRTLGNRVAFTITVLSLMAIEVGFWYWNYMIQMNQAMEIINTYMNMF